MNKENDYHISFFRPTTERAKYNRTLVLWLIGIWAIAIFGFHFLLRAIEKPTPEPQLIAFNEVWESVKNNNANNDQLKSFAHATLHVTGKVFIDETHRKALDNGITWAIMQLADSSQKIAFNSALVNFEMAAAKANSFTDQNYLSTKLELGAIANSLLELNPNEVLAKILPLELHSAFKNVFSDENKAIVEKCMPHYTIHNRSVLTDTQFLGFPFHYFYTAVFLLILFIVLCWIYCYRVDKYNEKIGIAE